MVKYKTFSDCIWVLTCDSSYNKEHIMTTGEAPILKQNYFFFTGMRFGLLQTKVGLVSLVSKYQLSVSRKTPVPLVFDTRSAVLFPKGGMWLQIRKRVE
jgi:hypothetical protein